MKRIRCPKCDESILSTKQNMSREESWYLNALSAISNSKYAFRSRKHHGGRSTYRRTNHLWQTRGARNAFHFKQEIPLYEGENVVGRLIKGSKANAAIKTVDPSMDTTHCIITVKPRPNAEPRFTLRDAPSNTGTFLQNEILSDHDRVNVTDGDIITIGATTMILRTQLEEEE